MKFNTYIQHDAMDCGATCLRMIAKYYGKNYNAHKLQSRTYISREGVTLLGISDASESIGMRTLGVKTTFDKLEKEKVTPFIVHWRQEHFVVVYKITANNVFVADPAIGKVNYSKSEFIKHWASTVENSEKKGVALLLNPSPDFYLQNDEDIDKAKVGFLLEYLRPHRKLIIQLFIGFTVGSLLQLILPFLMQSIVDFGISNQNLNFVYLVLIAQMILLISQMSVEFISSWILLHISTRINISLISDFLIKLMKLPISFFDSKMTGDLIQRIDDHTRIEDFLTTQIISTVFSAFNLIVFGAVLAWYSLKLLMIFLLGSTLYILWISIFMKKRRELDYKRFQESSSEQSSVIQLIQGMQEIKLHNAEKQMRWGWEHIQARLFKISIKGLTLSQFQQSGTIFINGGKNIFISFFAAYSVIKGDMTLGMMLAIQYIIGQLNGPIDNFIGFLHSLQDAKISLERLGDIHKTKNEESDDSIITSIMPANHTIELKNVDFYYNNPHNEKVLKNVSLVIPPNKVTAIVGSSGSGKTTLFKLLLGFYQIKQGEILLGNNHLKNYSQSWWRGQVGAVLQDGYIFNSSIATNIAIGHESIDKTRLEEASKIANIQEFIENLPLGYNTKIGGEGHGLSQGQKQRILIARAVYKNPKFIFFDEATNALDSTNEKIIMNNLNQFFNGRTVLIIAHRLSTVKNADQIVVLKKGEILEIGTHKELIAKQGAYYSLVEDQLELEDIK
ncbi:ABC transporter ATP-binding protein [Labilibaculum filiforme]|uniref:ABC transporter ATP-binding protein n=1 Tax=Labilibaculum filiforme TaxID=1940526 RepID=A0A2N3HXE5_9BACT|nr:peptidase domain-containing ABC transporter [Labilibaculum filiforme]PKQ62711.1 ABC transporter ATP-binding protein [Labilibaculum filiforme]